ncbi:MAG: phosphoribosylformylglycinamidine synthase, partial [Lentisphaeria bacterium]|nr:phosphoribosylformylglycinamidine synthase [Lentisphaeria bacterium]
MDFRIEISVKSNWNDSRAESVLRTIKSFTGKDDIREIRTRDVFTVCADITKAEAERIGKELANPVTQTPFVGATSDIGFDYDYIVSVGFKPGVTDNVGRTAHEAIGDIIGRKLRKDEQVFSSIEYFMKAPSLSREDVAEITGKVLANELIESVRVLSRAEAEKEGIPLNKPLVSGNSGEGMVRIFDLNCSDEELLEISRKGILALSLEEMKSIQNYFHTCKDREKYGLTSEPTDVELEILAQTWSEHCKHKIFSADVDYEDEKGDHKKIRSLFKTYIFNSTNEIKKKVNFLVSVFKDNAGVVRFNDKLDLVYKVETHNSPSALDPYGGAMTGIVGVNRDPMGTGQGAELLINVWGYCLGSPFTKPEDVPEGLLHPRRLRDGIHKGVIDGGNQSGIPYGIGWEYFDDRYIGKPLVYCGTVGTLPRKI